MRVRRKSSAFSGSCCCGGRSRSRVKGLGFRVLFIDWDLQLAPQVKVTTERLYKICRQGACSTYSTP